MRPARPAAAAASAPAPARSPTGDAVARIAPHLGRRTAATAAFFDAAAERVARLGHRMASRFARGGRLLALGSAPADRSDVRHVTVEFVHPVIVGKRALPAIGLTEPGEDLARQVELLAEPEDIVIAFGRPADDASLAAAVALARRRGCLTLAFAPSSGAAWELSPPDADPFVRQEVVEALYHVLWELVHVFLEHRGLLEGRPETPRHDPGAASFLYPFLQQRERAREPVLADAAASVRMKADEIAALKRQTLEEGAGTLLAAARALRARLGSGGRVLALGNGGSATDAADLVADLRAPPDGGRAFAAIDLTEDSAILTALANDVGPDVLFSRQVIAYGRPGDALVALTTSGGSRNVIAALAEARRLGLYTLALVGYGGGRIAQEALADDVIVTRSERGPRIQEAQASAYHVLCRLLRDADGADA